MAAPTTTALSDTILGQIEGHLEQTVPLLPKAFLRVLAKVAAGVVILCYKRSDSNALQLWVKTASMKETTFNGIPLTPLIEYGRQIGAGDPNPETYAELVVDVPVIVQTGYLSEGEKLLHKPTKIIYQVAADVPLDAATVQATIRSTTAGVDGNLEAGDELQFARTPPKLGGSATVSSVQKYAEDAESADDYRARVYDYGRAKPQGGAGTDYFWWGRDASGVKAAYPFKGDPGNVSVYVESTVAIDADGVPNSTVLTAASDAIELDVDGLASNRPYNSLVSVLAISRTEVTAKVYNLTGSDSANAATAIDAGVNEFLRSRRPYILGVTPLPREDLITQGEVAGVVVEIARAYGCTVSAVDLYVGVQPSPARILGPGELAKGLTQFL